MFGFVIESPGTKSQAKIKREASSSRSVSSDTQERMKIAKKELDKMNK